ncbi:MAG: HAD-IB family hydrolase [Deltaproteobacteria bacterium]|jgi:putative phosphoserine phosphatase/1-acylglycerol-3-phosphate O-acyltransferase|nr:HAD-IB family hydrolase [Deltaproteobacteria bacterium]
MPAKANLFREIRRAPQGPKVGAFFDVDRTLLAGFSASAFYRERLLSGRMTPAEAISTIRGTTGFLMGRTGFSGLMAASTAAWRGLSESTLIEIGQEVFDKHLATKIYPESRALLRAHRERGHTVAIISSATPYQVDPLARELEIENVMCTRLEVENGVFTGDVLKPTCFGEGKRLAGEELANRFDLDLSECFFYTDSSDDLPLLEAVGKPCPLNPDSMLAQISKERGWPVRRFQSRGTPGVEQIARSALALASLLPSVVVGTTVGLINRSQREAVNVAGSMWSDLSMALSGVDLRVEGEEHLWTHRPAVFIFNHQSALDAPLMLKMVRRDVTGVGKKEIANNPIFGPIGKAAGAVFIDRADRARAIEALEPAVDALKQGRSLIIAPEGTRQPTPRLGRFKKGAFHMAMQAGVPIVPVVFRNALDALPKDALVIRQAVVEAVVLPPVDTSSWTRETLDDEIAAIRDRYLEVLEG